MIKPEQIKIGGLYRKGNKVIRILSIFSAYSSAYGKNIEYVEVEWAAGKRLGQPSKIWWIGQIVTWAESVIDRQREKEEEEAALKIELKQINLRRKVIREQLSQLKEKHFAICLRCSTTFISDKDRFGRTIRRICPDCSIYNEQF